MLSAFREKWPLAVRWLPIVSFALFMVGVLAGLTKNTKEIHALGVQPHRRVGVGGLLAGLGVDRVGAVGLPGDQVERSRRGRAEHRVVGRKIAEREAVGDGGAADVITAVNGERCLARASLRIAQAALSIGSLPRALRK